MSSSTSQAIHFFYQTPVTLRNRTVLKQFVYSIFRKHGRTLESMNYIFCSDKKILEINREYLVHDYYTDIITFELSGPGEAVQAEVYISVDRVKDNAKQLGESFSRELHRVIFHGALHLCGFKDKTEEEEKKMRKLEQGLLDRYL